jgi:hypothetical protein
VQGQKALANNYNLLLTLSACEKAYSDMATGNTPYFKTTPFREITIAAQANHTFLHSHLELHSTLIPFS